MYYRNLAEQEERGMFFYLFLQRQSSKIRFYLIKVLEHNLQGQKVLNR